MNSEERKQALEERRELLDDRSERIWTKTSFEDFPVYRVPTELLRLNANNRRFRAEAQGVETELGRALDPEADEASIIALLLDKEPRVEGDRVVGDRNKDTVALEVDWRRRRQERPLWIRPDGQVSNGNRRLALVKRLAATEGVTGHEWVDVIFMDEDAYDDETLFEMEAREQLTEGYKVRYTKMNLLLTLRDAAERQGIDWHDRDSIKEVAERIQHLVANNPGYARVQLQAVKAMTDYLAWIERPDDFAALRNKVERFRDVGKNMEWLAENAPEHQAAMLELCFLAIQSGSSHPDIREIRKIVKRDPSSFEALASEVEEIASELDGDEPELTEAVPPDDEDPEDRESDLEDEVVGDGPSTARQRRIFEAVNAASQTSRAHGDPPQTKLRTAATKLGEVDAAELLAATSGGAQDRVRAAIAEVVAWAKAAETALRDGA
ncbi:MAG: hypothetical protein ACM3N0_10935 [Chloroflexota bacterium]